MNDEDEPLQDDFDEECYDAEDMDVDDEDDEDELLEDDVDEEGSDDEEAEEDGGSGESNVNETKIGHCCFCGAEVIVDELPDSISRDAFEDFGICLNCQWGIFMQNGGHF